jgi:hypothetical protein
MEAANVRERPPASDPNVRVSRPSDFGGMKNQVAIREGTRFFSNALDRDLEMKFQASGESVSARGRIDCWIVACASCQ